MLGTADAIAKLPVKDIRVARRFSDLLGFPLSAPRVTIWPSIAPTIPEPARPPRYGTLYDVDADVSDLETKASPFKRSEIPGVHRVGDVQVAQGGSMRTTWPMDAEGNICRILNG